MKTKTLMHIRTARLTMASARRYPGSSHLPERGPMKRFYLCLACILLDAVACAKGTQSLGATSTAGGTGGAGQSTVSSTSTGQGGAPQGSTSQSTAGPGGAGQGGAGQGGAPQGDAGPDGGDPCAPAPNDTTCDVCRKPTCCAELKACAANQLCACWVDCIDMHPNDPNNTVTCSGMCGPPQPALQQINGVFLCQKACGACPPVPWQ